MGGVRWALNDTQGKPVRPYTARTNTTLEVACVPTISPPSPLSSVHPPSSRSWHALLASHLSRQCQSKSPYWSCANYPSRAPFYQKKTSVLWSGASRWALVTYTAFSLVKCSYPLSCGHSFSRSVIFLFVSMHFVYWSGFISARSRSALLKIPPDYRRDSLEVLAFFEAFCRRRGS